MSTQDEITTTTDDRRPLDATVERVLGLGRLWAAYGLSAGKSALEASAATLRTSAEVLGEIAQRFEDRARTRDAG